MSVKIAQFAFPSTSYSTVSPSISNPYYFLDMITVHAIDSRWNRGVAQLPITLDNDYANPQ
mgnify:CR=1 FL=1